MRLITTLVICLATGYRPVIAAIADDLVEDVKPAPYNTTHEQTGTNIAESREQVLSEGSRGRMLHENHCASCHESLVYIRAKRKAKNYKDVSDWVSQRADWLNMGWTGLEKQQVTQYLNERYYKYPAAE